MSQADKQYATLLSQCVQPSVANTFMKGFKGAATYRSRYEGDYNSKCKTSSGGTKPNTSVFTPELIADLEKENKANMSVPPKAPAPKPAADKPAAPKPAADKPAADKPAADKPKDDKKSADPDAACPNNMKGYVFCNHKFKKENVLKGSSSTTEKNWKGCRQRCWDHGVSCRGWSWKDGSGSCQLYDTSTKQQMIYQKGFASGPRSNPSTSTGGAPSSNTSTETNTTTTTTDSNPTFAYDPPDAREWWQKDDIISGVENWVLISAVCCLFVIMGGGMMMMMMM